MFVTYEAILFGIEIIKPNSFMSW